MKIHPVPVLQNPSKAFQQPDLALEDRLAGSDEIKLIHGTHSFPTFIQKFCQKYNLGKEQMIYTVKAKISDKIFDVNLKEPKDWGYILQ